MATDAKGRIVVIEVKANAATDAAVGQIARYLGWLTNSDKKPAVRGILVAADFTEGVRYAAMAIPNLELHAYRIQFSFDKVRV